MPSSHRRLAKIYSKFGIVNIWPLTTNANVKAQKPDMHHSFKCRQKQKRGGQRRRGIAVFSISFRFVFQIALQKREEHNVGKFTRMEWVVVTHDHKHCTHSFLALSPSIKEERRQANHPASNHRTYTIHSTKLANFARKSTYVH